eukprot:scaffold88080_cov65-Phaeocystis_antarctica.AAC.2
MVQLHCSTASFGSAAMCCSIASIDRPRSKCGFSLLRLGVHALAATDTTAPLSARPPLRDEALCSLLPLRPIFTRRRVRLGPKLRL